MTKVKSLALVLSFFLIFVLADDITCIQTFTTLEAFVDCLDKHTVPESFYSSTSYTTAQPSGSSQRTVWTDAVNTMLTQGCPPGPPGSKNITEVKGLQGDYVIASVTESGSGGGTTYTWCVLVEARTIATGSLVFKRGWGYVVTPADPVKGVARHLHFSAPHPKADANTPRQAAALFKRTGSKSLVVTGRHRKAYATGTLCSVAPSPDTYYKTDSSHDNNEPFCLAVAQVATWQDANGGCPWASCAYIQMHGKSDNANNITCPEYNVFMSSGLGNSLPSETCYANTLLPVTRLKEALITTFPEYKIATPTETGTCDLTATRNIFGRLVSGIDASDVCVNSGTITTVIPCTCKGTKGCMGKFVHIEQDPDLRLATNYGKWVDTINGVFPETLRGTKMEESIFKIQS